MTEFPWNSFWRLAHSFGRPDWSSQQVLGLLVRSMPIRSLSLIQLLGPSTDTAGIDLESAGLIRRIFYAQIGQASSPGSLDRPCSLSRWLELQDWVQSGMLLKQPSPKRSGKLAWLATEELDGSLVAIPLRPSGSQASQSTFGAALVEIEHGRSLADSMDSLLADLACPLSFLLDSLIHKPLQASQNRAENSPKPVAQDSADSQALDSEESIVGSAQGLRKVMQRVALVSLSDMPVLILGDTGTGKEVIARAIHSRSTRSGQPFLRVNCGAIPPELIDSQLFGHERGSFTGASDQRRGWFERAHGGTLFLDEVGELPLAAQVRLLRVLQEHQIERVGGEKTIEVDVRIVAATHRDLATMVHQRTFREDLWYRINLFPILLPRLCERIEDIPALTRHFARKAAAKLGLPYADPTTSDIDRLLKYSWPGNIRELQAVVDRAVILGRGHHLDIATALGASFNIAARTIKATEEPTYYEVIPESSYLQPQHPPVADPNSSLAPASNSSILPLNEMIKQHIERALLRSQGQVEGKRGAAGILQINPHTLRAKMRKLGIRWSDYRVEDS